MEEINNVPIECCRAAMKEVADELKRLSQNLEGAEWFEPTAEDEFFSTEIHDGRVLNCTGRGADVTMAVLPEKEDPAKYLMSTGPETFVDKRYQYTLTPDELHAGEVKWFPGRLTSERVAKIAYDNLISGDDIRLQ